MNLKDSLFSRISSLLKEANSDFKEVYLVGGSIRDRLIGKENFDLDFVMPDHAIKAAKLVADALNGDFFVLDDIRGTGRAIVEIEKKKKYIDFANFNGLSIFEDLSHRDFTFNALAIDISKPEEIIDPLSGEKHLKQKKLYPCSKNSFSDDPIRILRAIRFISTLNLEIDDPIINAIRKAAGLMPQVSNERIRDELFRILSETDIADSLHRIISFGIFKYIFPELDEGQESQLEGLDLEPLNKYRFKTASKISKIIDQINGVPSSAPEEIVQDLNTEFNDVQLHLKQYFSNPFNPSRRIRELIIIGALFHISAEKNVGVLLKSDENKNSMKTDKKNKNARIWGKRMALSKVEIDFVNRMATCQFDWSRSIDIADADSREKIYKFYKSAEETGVAQCLYHLAEMLAFQTGDIYPHIWKRALKFARLLLEAWFLHKGEFIDPPRLINGNEILNMFNIERGPRVGDLLEEIRIAQVRGSIITKRAAIEYCKKLLKT